MDIRHVAALGGTSTPGPGPFPPVPAGRAREQLVLSVDGAPFGPKPGQPDNRIFLDEIEFYPSNWVAIILDTFQARGGTGFAVGSGWSKAYDGQYPDTDWRDVSQANAIVGVAEECVRRNLTLTLVVGTATTYRDDQGHTQASPFWDDRNREWRLDKMTAELAEVYKRIIATGAVRKIRLEWEEIQSSDCLCKLTQWVRNVVGWRGKISYHTEEGHIWPGLGSEDEKGVLLAFAAAGGTTIDMQGFSPTDFSRNLPPKEQTVYDWQDGNRRLTGVPVDLHDGKGNSNPWGNALPILNCDGVPLEIIYSEGPSEDYYHYRDDGHFYAEFREALAAVGALDCEDGL